MAEPLSGRWRLGDFLLAELLVITLAWGLAIAAVGARALPWTTDAVREGDANHAVAIAAERGVAAFLDIDYRDVDARSRRVLDRSTGGFKQQYAERATDLRIATMRARSVTTGTIRAVAVHGVEGNRANALVAADATVKSTVTRKLDASRSCPKNGVRCSHYRFLVTLTRVGDRWLMSDLAQVP